MWVGADYRPVSGKWKWRNAFVGFDGTLNFSILQTFKKSFNSIIQIEFHKIPIIMFQITQTGRVELITLVV